MTAAPQIFSEPLDWMFWPPLRPRPDSAWLGHIPFAHWVVTRLRPGTLVELGTHSGASYASFCDAVVRNGYETRCFAVDTWEGDAHTGSYGEEIHADLHAFNEQRFAGFSRLMRTTFDSALAEFADGSVDLLHIDGWHTYEAVTHDFESWRPKLSERAIVLFHDTAERTKDFGVWKLWDELRPQYATFEFTHSHGLGVLGYGGDVEPAVAALFESDAAVVRQRFEALGRSVQMHALAARKQIEAEHLKQMLRARA
jgi:hypothetical protein